MFETVVQPTARENLHLCYKNVWQILCMITSPGLSLNKTLSIYPTYAFLDTQT